VGVRHDRLKNSSALRSPRPPWNDDNRQGFTTQARSDIAAPLKIYDKESLRRLDGYVGATGFTIKCSLGADQQSDPSQFRQQIEQCPKGSERLRVEFLDRIRN
jgi:hypothetical protein